MTTHLDGRIAIVTGGAGGIGSQIAKVFGEQGARVVVADTGFDVEGRAGMDASRVQAVVDDIVAAGGEAVPFVGDVADMDSAERMVELAIETYGDLDILVCAHGILRERMIFNMSEDDWDESVRVHLKGCFAPTKFASIHWRANREKGNRRVIYFTSDAGIRGEGGQPNYSAAHAGKLGLMRSNAQALARYGATCNCIAPGAATRMTDRAVIEGVTRSDSAAGQPMDPKNVVPIIVWLASVEGGQANGRVFAATGHRISLFREHTRERYLHYPEPLIDIDRLFELWPDTLGLRDFPKNQFHRRQ
jgi:NAD(P)-dependent dehydrogenase (short-subunit alcohol dehydrogenase family)